MRSDRVKIETYTKKYWKDMSLKEKISYFFDYFLWQTIVAIASVAIIISLVVSYLTSIDVDLYVMIAGETYIDSEYIDKMKNDLKEYIIDLDGDDRQTAEISNIILQINTKDAVAEEYNQAMITKMAVQLAAGDPMLVILSPLQYQDFKYKGIEFVDISQVTEKSIEGSVVLVKDTKLANYDSFKILPDNYVLGCIYMEYNDKTSKTKKTMYENTKETFMQLIK